MTLRLSKILVVLSAALFALLVGVNNIIDYESNFTFVQHVLMMDTLWSGEKSSWRALQAPWTHHLAYCLIILSELLIGLLGIRGAIDLWQARRRAALFNQQKAKALTALTLGVLLWFTGFMVIAGEWFLMWQSETWNAQQSAFRFAILFLCCLIFVSIRDEDD